jgi:hypothetical protein
VETEAEVEVLVVTVETRIEDLGTRKGGLAQRLQTIDARSGRDREHRSLSSIGIDGEATVDLHRQPAAVEGDAAAVDRRAVGADHGALNRRQLGFTLERAGEGAEPAALRHRVIVEDGHSLDPVRERGDAEVDRRREPQPLFAPMNRKDFGPVRCGCTSRQDNHRLVGRWVERAGCLEAVLEVGRSERRNDEAGSHGDQYSYHY